MILYVYGTLRPGTNDIVAIPGKLYDLGWFPGAILGDEGSIICEKVSVDSFDDIDRYEGFNPRDPEGSLFIRKEVLDGYIYVYNTVNTPVKEVFSGNWLEYTSKEEGRNSARFNIR